MMKKKKMGGAPAVSPTPKLRPRGLGATKKEMDAMDSGFRMNAMEGRERDDGMLREKMPPARRAKKMKGMKAGGMTKKGYAAGGMMKKKGYAAGGMMKKKGYKKGGKIRGYGLARGGKVCKMR